MGNRDEHGRGNQGNAQAADRARPAEPDPLAGTPYRTLGKLGAGSMGLVLEAEHRTIQKRVVVKILHAHLVTHADLVDRMHLEARSLAALDGHPNIVAVTDFGATATGRPYFVMERLVGRTLLAERKKAGRLPPALAIDFTCQALAGLAAAHAAGIVHRDVKPANLFLCDATPGRRRVLKVLDFGVAKLVGAAGDRAPTVAAREHATEEKAIVGTIPYLAPEQVVGGEVDARTDLYAMGAVLFSLLTGRAPFEHHPTQNDMLRAHLVEPPRAPSELAGLAIPAALDRAVLRALAKDPHDRFPDAKAFADELARVAGELPPRDAATTPEPPPLREPPSTERRRPARLPGSVATPLTLALVWLVSMATTVALGRIVTEVLR